MEAFMSMIFKEMQEMYNGIVKRFSKIECYLDYMDEDDIKKLLLKSVRR